MSSDILGEPSNFVGSTNGGGAYIGYRSPKRSQHHSGSGQSSASFAATDPRRLDLPVNGELPPDEPVDEVNVVTVNDNNPSASSVIDNRVKIRVPDSYIVRTTRGSNRGELFNAGGIIFPYTPTISLEHKADYTEQKVTHSNYALNFYKNSAVSDITIVGKFTVQNDADALVYLSTVQLLSALTKMRWGGPSGDSDSGAPPPVCRLDAYGAYMLKNVPVVISSFKHDLPDDVDFYTVTSGPFGVASVPVRSTFTVNCKPMYSRQEMLGTSVTKYLSDPSTRNGGFL